MIQLYFNKTNWFQPEKDGADIVAPARTELSREEDFYQLYHRMGELYVLSCSCVVLQARTSQLILFMFWLPMHTASCGQRPVISSPFCMFKCFQSRSIVDAPLIDEEISIWICIIIIIIIAYVSCELCVTDIYIYAWHINDVCLNWQILKYLREENDLTKKDRKQNKKKIKE